METSGQRRLDRTTEQTERKEQATMKVLFVAGFGPISRDIAQSRGLYQDVLGVPFHTDDGLYHHTEELAGAKAFAIWPLSQAAQSTFGTDTWPEHLPVPQAWLEFDVEDLAAATAELRDRGYELLIENRTEPWGQSVTRFLSPEGILVAVSHTPWMRDPDGGQG
jgi:catechol 2,3-dioxygenase-like lactoylglutathione lyase family enzyme